MHITHLLITTWAIIVILIGSCAVMSGGNIGLAVDRSNDLLDTDIDGLTIGQNHEQISLNGTSFVKYSDDSHLTWHEVPCDFSTNVVTNSTGSLFNAKFYLERVEQWGIDEDNGYIMMLFNGGIPVTINRSQEEKLITSIDNARQVTCLPITYNCYSNTIDDINNIGDYDGIKGIKVHNISDTGVNSMLSNAGIVWDFQWRFY